ncbi:NAD(P)H-dependent glycerol-3-phosphate dehydrogenase [Candidatus Dependentiae bacterium]
MKKVCMLGSGAFATAVSALLADNGLQVNMWCYDPMVAKSVETKHCNEAYFPDAKLSENIKPFIDIEKAMDGCEIIFEATPVAFLRSVLQKAKPYFSDTQTWVVLSKGIENETLLFSSQIIDDIFQSSVKKVVVSGPSFAKDIIAKQVTGVDIASKDEKLSQNISQILSNDYFKTFFTTDTLGLQIGGALKNVAAIAIGMLDGAGHADNTKAFALHEFLQEMLLFAKLLGAQEKTLYGLSGIGDLVATCMGGSSRNLMFGRLLGQGKTLKEAKEVFSKIGNLSQSAVPEGINTVKSVYQMTQLIASLKKGEKGYEMAHSTIIGDKLLIRKEEIPKFRLFETIYAIIFEDQPVESLVRALLQ